MQPLHERLIAPCFSKKSLDILKKFSTYTFFVANDANKFEIKKMIQEAYSVKVSSVRTMITHGKYKRSRSGVYRQPSRKKAMIKLSSGVIDILREQQGA